MLELKGVSKAFFKGTVNERVALEDVSLELLRGDFAMILGSNGSGKSSLFNAICGKFELDSGQVFLDGKRIDPLPDYKRALEIGRIMQDPMKGTAPGMTIEENLSLAYTRKAKKSFFAVSKKDRGVFRQALEGLGMGLEDRLTDKVGLLSGGQRQAVALLMATIAEPKLLLFDEHTAALDPAAAKKVMEMTVAVAHQKQIAAMVITHDINAAIMHGNRILMMNEAKIALDIASGQKKELTPEKLLELYSQKSNTPLPDRVILG
ncbi:MAG: ATP-binding cassette domain-containing protein [Eubacteriaceae bacterium]|nr:ATP-binding cassette domain-containing protein [Eubacteriaceae bacterium]